MMFRVQFEKNTGVTGGCMYITNTELIATQSEFRDNLAIQGGVIFAIQSSTVDFRTVNFLRNFAQDGSTFVGIAN